MSIFRNVNLISLQEWNKLVREVYGKPYDFQQQDGCKAKGVVWEECPSEGYDYEKSEIPLKVNGDEMGVSFKTWLETPADIKWFEDAWDDELFWERNFYPSIDMIINDLHEKGFIPEGDFGIEIDW